MSCKETRIIVRLFGVWRPPPVLMRLLCRCVGLYDLRPNRMATAWLVFVCRAWWLRSGCLAWEGIGEWVFGCLGLCIVLDYLCPGEYVRAMEY